MDDELINTYHQQLEGNRFSPEVGVCMLLDVICDYRKGTDLINAVKALNEAYKMLRMKKKADFMD
ncbi:hypothetical protein [Paenibacillus senegalensis]|uniref:hypothetical protein n=1 Tax=Paenibacillus senegalensis TaxID=1465766 RepID=UPI000287CA98|nr:hypothetical protein [Paenibacillus senegalensis]